MKHITLLGKKRLLIALTCLLAFLATPAFAEDEEAAPVTPSYIELTPDFIVNYNASGSRLHYIKTKISLRTDSAREGIILANMPLIRDSLVMFLSSRNTEQVTGAIAREQTRTEAKVAINETLKEETGTEPVMDVLFFSFVTQ
ncbi:flagellar basal body-associated protein FliL-like protein [Marinomonas gallaica]|uniref:Flagellar protein FliL n=1 Tax=Marinomonas gallaica TaxID=1806667 RepID=A0A1C3JVP5_9GAMM|nr:flagellar basal body-associated FliL family protein [Marinomonas gallaica]SBT19263.1 flagellar basal body-associated protein FliL-like protein [Marinomonas gallaica]SBT20952.1 flagellar basal body-associated protein FliL-like protein [Marinomonas gallaica]